MSDTSKYNQRGVSASKEDVHQAIKHINKGLYPKAFCKIIPDLLVGDENYCTIMHADGAGTKSSFLITPCFRSSKAKSTEQVTNLVRGVYITSLL